MADKMMRMAGRGEDGKAKALRTNNQGDQYVQLTGSYGGYSTEDKDVIVPNPQRNDDFLEWDTGDIYFYDGTQWVKF